MKLTFVHKLGLVVWALVSGLLIFAMLVPLGPHPAPPLTREDEWARAVMIGFLLVLPLLFVGVAKLVEKFNPAADEFIARHGPPPVDPRQRNAYQNLMGGLKSAADDLVEKRKDD